VREPRELLTGLQNAGVARLYLMLLRGAERRGAAIAGHRGSLLAGLHGRVLELGARKGLNFAHYPPTVTEVVATEPDVLLREQALAQAARSPVRVRVLADAAGFSLGDVDRFSFRPGVIAPAMPHVLGRAHRV